MPHLPQVTPILELFTPENPQGKNFCSFTIDVEKKPIGVIIVM